MSNKVEAMEQFVPYYLALKLFHFGFKEPCFGHYMNSDAWLIDLTEGSFYIKDKFEKDNSEYSIPAPLWQQAFEWFRKIDDWPFESYITPSLSPESRQYVAKYWTRGEEVSVGVYTTHNEAQYNLLYKIIEVYGNRPLF